MEQVTLHRPGDVLNLVDKLGDGPDRLDWAPVIRRLLIEAIEAGSVNGGAKRAGVGTPRSKLARRSGPP